MQDLKDIWAICISLEIFNEEFRIDVRKSGLLTTFFEMQMLVDQTNALTFFLFVSMETWKR